MGKKLYVGNLAFEVTDKDLEELFAQAGICESVAEIAKESAKTGTPIPTLLRQKKLLSEEEISRIFTPEFLAGQADRR